MKQIYADQLDYCKGKILARDIYCKDELIFKKDTVLDLLKIEKLKELSKENLIIILIKEDVEQFQTIPLILHAQIKLIFNESINDLLNKYSFSTNDDSKLIKELLLLFLDNITTEDFFKNYLENLYILSHDVFSHVIRVAVLSMFLGIKANYSKDIIKDLGIGALLHDIGKIKIFTDFPKLSLEYRNYNYIEYELIKTHPFVGYKDTEENKLISNLSRKIILLHHVWEDYKKSYDSERMTYLSYPNHYYDIKVTKDMKDQTVNIVQVANCYDKLFYEQTDLDKQQVSRIQIMDYIKNNGDIIFNKFASELLCKYISKYEVGSKVYLSNNKTAKILKHTNDVDRPIIKVFDDNKIINLNEKANKNINIIKVLNKEGDLIGRTRNSKKYNYM